MTNLKVVLGMDGANFTAGISKAKSAVSNFAGDIKNQIAGAFTFGAVSAFTKRTIEFAGSMRDLSDRLGVNVEWLQKMNNAFKQAGSSAEDFANFVNKLNQSRETAVAKPEGKEAATFGRLGMSRTDLTGLSTQEFVTKLSESLSKGFSVQAENDLQEVGGRSAKNLIAAFAGGLEAGGPIISETLIDDLDELGDSFFLLQQSLMVGFAPAIKFVADRINDVITGFNMMGAAIGAFVTNFFSGKSLKQVTREAYQGIREEQEAGAARSRAAEERRESRRANRNRREGLAPVFRTEDAQQKPATKASRTTDQLLSVGNFLGSGGRSNIESVFKEQLKVQRDQLRNLETIARNTGSNGIKVPTS